MKNILQKWRGLAAGAALLTAATLTAAETPVVKTLGGGPNQTSSARAGSTDGQTLNFAKFKKPYAAALDSNGDLFIADFGNGKIRKVTNPGAADSVTSTFVSGLNSPSGVAIGASNIVYVVTQGDGKLRKYSSTGVLLETVNGFKAPTAVALSPTAAAFGTNGSVFVAELGGNVYQVPLGDVPMLIGSGFRRPRGIVVLGNGFVAVAESSGHAVRLLDPDTGVSTLLAGGNGAGFADGSVAKFNQPYGIALAPNGSLIVADKLNHRVRVIGTNNVVSTLYGVPKISWVSPFPGWVDGAGGANGVAAAHDPVGVAVANGGNVYTTEIFYNLLRQVTSTGLASASGVVTNDVTIGTNIVSVVGTNTVSLGFVSGEASSDYVGAAGQHFYVPVTLSSAPGQSIYTFQMGLSATGETGVALSPSESGFVSMVFEKVGNNSYRKIRPNYEFLNSSINLLGVGWLTRYELKDLYDTLAQDLITYSLPKNTLYGKDSGRVILGAYRVAIPSAAPTDATFRVAVRNASGTADGVSRPVALRMPTTEGFGAGTLNTIKRISLASRLYLVGDGTPFRWFNAGDFGNSALANDDVTDLFQTAIYGINFHMKTNQFGMLVSELQDSDLWNCLDASDGSSSFSFGDDVSINSVVNGDGQLAVDDVWVTFRRSLDPTLTWYARYWSNGVLNVTPVPNTLIGGFGTAASPVAGKKKTAVQYAGPRPTAEISAGDAMTSPGASLEIPVHLNVSAGFAARVLMLGVTFEALDGSPSVALPISMQTTPAFQDPEFSDSRGPNDFGAAWLNNSIPGVAGNSLFGILTVRIPVSAGNRAAYRVVFNHFSASPNGTALFASRTSPGLILLSDRSASTWNDGIADAWRLRCFGSIYASESAVGADADGDGVVNSIEYQNGTNPTDATSF